MCTLPKLAKTNQADTGTAKLWQKIFVMAEKGT